MPLLVVAFLVLLSFLTAVVLMPVGLVQRYRAGTARRVVRGWVAGLNIAALSFSVLIFLGGAVITTLWVPNALGYSLAGLGSGCLFGMLGLALTRWEGRWERAPGNLYYTPNRWLVLAITLVVTARVAYGVWRLWQGWSLGVEKRAWIVKSGVAGSMAAGAVVLGYSLTYWIGVSRRARHR